VNPCGVAVFVVIAALAACRTRQSADTPAKARFDSAKAAAHTEKVVFGPIWPHDSACFVWLHAEVAAGHLRSGEDEVAANAFAHCTDTAELEARKHPLTPQRRAMMDARRDMGLPAQPLISFEKKE